VGSRPYRRDPEDQRRFFGREREIGELVSLLFAHPLVLVYAESGAGKTSLCSAGVIPELERRGFEVLPVARLRATIREGFDPAGSRNPYVFNLIASLAPDADPATFTRSSLAEYLKTLGRGSDARGKPKPRALFIDQGEEIFTYLPQDWMAHQRDLFAQMQEALQDDPLLRIAFVMREDFLGRMMTFAPLFGEELRVRLRIECLSREQALAAIEGPLGDSHRSFAPGVAAELVDELAQIHVDDGTGAVQMVAGLRVEPVHLQIVCELIWRELSPDETILTREHVGKFGGVDQALRQFFESALAECVAKAHVSEIKLRRWFGEKLITSAGTRGMVFQEKQTTGGISNQAVSVLEERHIVRAEARAGGRWYELSHDRLIGPIRDANREWERTSIRARVGRYKKGAIAAVILLVAGLASSIWISRRNAIEQMRQVEERARTIDPLEAISREPGEKKRNTQADGVFDVVAGYLWAKKDIEGLIRVSKQYADLIPPWYGLESINTDVELPDLAADWPLQVESSVDLNPWRLRPAWSQIVRTMAQMWGIPLPSQVRFVLNRSLPASQAKIVARGTSCDAGETSGRNKPGKTVSPLMKLLEKPLPGEGNKRESIFPAELELGGYAVVSEAELPAPLRPYFKAHHADWRPIHELPYGGPWWFVPRWFLPLLKVVGGSASSRENLFATIVANELLKAPELAITCDSAKLIAAAVHETWPSTAEQALAARGGWERLRQDLVEIVGKGTPITHPVYVLDALATQGARVSSADVAAFADRELSATVRAGGRIEGPRATAWSAAELARLSPEALPAAYKENWGELGQAITAPIRVFLGRQMTPLVVLGNNHLRPEVLDALADMRARVYRRYGIAVPAVRFLEEDKTPWFRIEILNQNDRHEDAQPIAPPAAGALQRLFDEIEARYRGARSWWLDVDSTARLLENLAAGQREWLGRHFSLTDLTKVLRRVLVNDSDPVEDDGSVVRTEDLGDDGRTIRETAWLLGSIPFWRAAGEAEDADKLAQALRHTQQARLRPSTGGPVAGPALAGVEDEIAALGRGEYAGSEERFKRAVQRDPAGARAAFLAFYPADLRKRSAKRTDSLVASCQIPACDANFAHEFRSRRPTQDLEYKVFDALDDPRGATPEVRRALGICLLWSYAGADQPARTARLFEEWARPDRPGTAREAFFLAYSILAVRQHDMKEPPELPRLRALLAQVFQQTKEHSEDAFLQLLQLYDGPAPPLWFANLLGTAVVDNCTNKEPLLHAAWWLAQMDEERTRLALSALDRLARVPALDDARFAAERGHQVKWVRARALLNLARVGPNRERLTEQAIVILLALKETLPEKPKYHPTLDEVYDSLLDAYTIEQRFHDRDRLVDEMLEKFPQAFSSLSASFSRHFAEGHIEQARQSAADLTKLFPKNPAGRFLTALIEVLTRSPTFESAARAFLYEGQHEYQDYIRLMLAWVLRADGRHEDADQFLDERWKEINPGTWPVRLEQGDRGVWRERLIGYAAGHVDREDVVGPLKGTKEFARSDLSKLGFSLDEIRCEGFFYDALVQAETGDPKTAHARFVDSLKRAANAGVFSFYELHMARYLLKGESSAAPRDQ